MENIFWANYGSNRFREEVVKSGGRTKHSLRLDGKPRKCLTLPKKAMTTQQWETVTAALLRIGIFFTSKSHSFAFMVEMP